MSIHFPTIAWDDQLFRFLNGHAHAAWLDVGMRLLTQLGDAKAWLFAGVVLALVFTRGRTRVALVVGLLAVGASDTLVSKWLKPWFARPRPLAAGLAVRVLAQERSSWGFPSAHAANTATLAAVLMGLRVSGSWWFVALSLFAGYSRVYVGVHRPLDVLAGWMFGAGFGALVALVTGPFLKSGKKAAR